MQKYTFLGRQKEEIGKNVFSEGFPVSENKYKGAARFWATPLL